MAYQINNAAVLVNGSNVATIVNSVSFTEGEGEQEIRAVSIGNGDVRQLFVDNLEGKFSMVKFSLAVTSANIQLARGWKKNANRNEIQIAGSTIEGRFNRVFTQAALTNDYEVALQADGVLELEFHSNRAI